VRKRESVKPITFRVYPEGSYLYCTVNIWPNKKAMLDHTRLPGRSYDACCGARETHEVLPNGRTRRTGLFAEANFNRHKLGVGLTAHEFTHAAFVFARRRKLTLTEAANKQFRKGRNRTILAGDSPEETFCYALGEMCRQFTLKCYALKLYKRARKDGV